MKKTLRLISAFLALCLVAALFPPVGLAAGGKTHTVPNQGDVNTLIDSTAVSAGDIIHIENSGYVRFATEDPWVISKDVIIEGGTLQIDVSGIILNADVTFRNVGLSFNKPARNAIMANGHTLTLENVTCANYSFNLFCGGFENSNNEQFVDQLPNPGQMGILNIKGNTSIQNKDTFGSGNIFTGNLSMGGTTPETSSQNAPPNVFQGDATINIECSASSTALGTVYACGAQQKNPEGTLATKRMYPDSGKYTVSGTVTITGVVPNVEGAGSTATNVSYRGDGNEAQRNFSNISSLSVESGNLQLQSGSSFRGEKTLSVSAGAKLDLTQLEGRGLEVQKFDSNGYLILGQNQTWSIAGDVTGTTKVAIGRTNNDNTQSTKLPIEGHKYIQALHSEAGNFVLLPYSTQPNMTLVRDGNGNWTASNGSSSGEDLVKNFSFDNSSVEGKNGEEVQFPLTVESKSGGLLYLDFIPLTIEINNRMARRSEQQNSDGDTYYVYQDTYLPEIVISGNILYITPDAEWGHADSPYTIKVTVPSTHTADKTNITKTATLTVTDSGSPDPGLIPIPIPTAVTGLKWTGAEQTGVEEGTGYTLTGHTETAVGNYKATAKLKDGYQWSDGTTEDKTISWSIAKGDGPDAPTGLLGKAPTTENGTDGKITGTDTSMEYASDNNFTSTKNCSDGETSNLAAGTYYVRVKGTENREPGAAATVIVPAYGAPEITSISIKTPASKTEYRVGEPLDVTGLTITVHYSDQSTKDIAVTEEMVTGFDSSQAAENQTLTINWQGQTVTYMVKILADEPAAFQVTVSGSHAAESGAGAYQAGSTVTVHAGSYAGHVFAGWEASGVTLADRTQPDVSFVMPESNVNLTATWQADSTEPPTPGHTHAWKAEWETSKTHHWHSCAVPNCPVTEDSQKFGYAAHTPGSWVVDQAATSYRDGSRHRACSVCGYVTDRETIPATGGGSWGGGSGGSSGPSSNRPSTSTEKHPDGSTTQTVTDKTTGTVTVTTQKPDGTQTVVETQKDGTVTTTETTADSTVKTVERPDGTSSVTIEHSGGITAELSIEASGRTEAAVQIPQELADEARKNGETIPLPIPETSIAQSYANAPAISVNTSGTQPVRVEIPVKDPVPGAVAVLVRPDGAEEVVRNSLVTDTSLILTVPGGAVVRLVDNSKYFSDTTDHWAQDAIDFVSARELFSGQGADRFAPDEPMTRAMLVTVLARLDGVDTSGGAVWYEKGTAWAVAQGISDGSNLENQVTREQLVTMLYRYAGRPAAGSQELPFRDSDMVSGYAREAMCWAVENGILNGYDSTTLLPGGQATRAQVSAILMRYINYLN